MKDQAWDLLPLVNNVSGQKKRFELHQGGEIVFIEYIRNNNNIIFLTHTEVPGRLEGKGLGTIVVPKTFSFLKENGFKMAPLCPFVAAYLKRHPEEAEGLLAPGYSVI